MLSPLPRRSAPYAIRRIGAIVFALAALAGCDLLFPPEEPPAAPPEIVFHTLGPSFSAKIFVADGAAVRWTFADGSTSADLSPVKDYGMYRPRSASLLVTPWSALIGIDVGYDAGDGGQLPLYDQEDENAVVVQRGYALPGQDIWAIENLDLVRDSLEVFCASNNQQLISLDFSGFSRLHTIECYLCSGLFSVSLDDLPALRRACFEDCDLYELDLSGCPALADLRGAVNGYPTIVFGDFPYPDVWHICVRDNGATLQSDPDLFADTTRFPNLTELFIWNDGQTGTLRIPHTGPGNVSILVAGNAYSTLDLQGALLDTGYSGNIDVSYNRLTAINLAGCVQVTNFTARSCQLSAGQMADLLTTLYGLGRENSSGNHDYGTWTVDLSGNSAPDAAVMAAAELLRARGWAIILP